MISQQVVACALALLGSTNHLRVTNVRILEVLQFARERSATFRELLAAVDTSNRVIYIEEGTCRRGTVRSCVQTIGKGPYIRVLIDPRQPITRVVREIAHEFQHVLEIATSDVTGADSLQNLYHRIGFRSCAPDVECYETWRALRVESTVSREVSAGVPSLNSAHFGTWRLDIGKSSFTTCPPSAGRRFDRDQRHGLASAVVEYIDCVGVEHRDAFVYKADGRDYPMGNGDVRTSPSIAVSIIDRLMSTFIVKVDGVIVACGKRTLSANGKTLTIETWTIVNGEDRQRTFEWWEKVD